MGISNSPDLADSLDRAYITGRKTITSSAETIAAASSSNLATRQTLIIYNTSDTVTVYFGPTGFTAGGASSTGLEISPRATARLDFTGNNNVYLRTNSGTADVIIQEAG